MQIHRYLQRRKNEGVQFPEHFREYTYDYQWYIGDKMIGITPNSSTPAESFVSGFLDEKSDRLILIPSRKSPVIYRDNVFSATMSGRNSGIREVCDLIEFLQGQEDTHAFISYSNEDGKSRELLTFSTIAPQFDLYEETEIMPVEIDHKTLELERRLENFFAK